MHPPNEPTCRCQDIGRIDEPEYMTWLLSQPALDDSQLESQGYRPQQLIEQRRAVALLDADGQRQFPAFQFDEQGQLRPLVALVNAYLAWTDGPEVIVGWWLSGDGRLEEAAAPVTLLDTPQESRLITLAMTGDDDF
jgi:hypothetical protein